MRELRFKPQARLDLLDIWHFIAQDSVSTANRVGEEFDATLRDLTVMPGKGHRRADVKEAGFHFWNLYSYVIAYRYDDASVTIVRVIHGRRNFRKLFRKRS